jgi:PAS domain S-box-containing protein
MVDRNGAEIPVEVTGTPIVDDNGKTIGAVIIFRDVSERKVTGEALRRDHDLLQAVVQGTSDIIFLENLEGRFIIINEAGVRTLARPESEIIGKADLEVFDPTTANKMTRARERALQTGEGQAFECRIASEGTERTYLVSTEPCRGRDGASLGVVGIARDITDLKTDRPPAESGK